MLNENDKLPPNSMYRPKAMEINYDVSGQGADNVELQVWLLGRERMDPYHREQGKTDGYFEADFVHGTSFYVCFNSLDRGEKDLGFLVNQVTKN